MTVARGPWGPAGGSTVVISRDGDELVFTWAGLEENVGAQSFELVRFNEASRLLRIFPCMHAIGSLDEFLPQFNQVQELQLEADAIGWKLSDAVDEDEGSLRLVESDSGELELPGMPNGFGKYFQYGLGFPRGYRGFVRTIEDLTACTVVRFGYPEPEGVRGSVCHVSLDRFARYKHDVDLNRDRGATVVGRVNAVATHNLVAELVGQSRREINLGRHPTVQAMTRAITDETPLADDERDSLMERMAIESRRAATVNPHRFGKLRHDIELVSLEVLITRFEHGLKDSGRTNEAKWQAFFEQNVFALQQLFAAPIALFGSQLTVRAPNIHGAGTRIADFVLVNTLTRTAVVVEIKTPSARLIGRRYRGADEAVVYPPHWELAGAVAQLHAQMESVRSDFPQLLQNTAQVDPIDPLTVRGAVLAGTLGQLELEERDSFVRYRDGLHGVEVLAFDEVLRRLSGLHEFLSGQR